MKADLIIINPDSAAMLPIHDPIANIVTAMHESNVESVMCNGGVGNERQSYPYS